MSRLYCEPKSSTMIVCRRSREYISSIPPAKLREIFSLVELRCIAWKYITLRALLLSRLQAGYTLRANLGAVPHLCWQNHAIARREIDLARIARDIGQDKADRASHTIQDFLIAMTMNAVAPVSYTHLRAHETRHDLVC